MISMSGLAAKTLRRLREMSGLSMQEMADALGMVKSSYQYYEDKYKNARFKPELAERIIPVLLNYGVPDAEVRALVAPLNSPANHHTPNVLLPDRMPTFDRTAAPRNLPVMGTGVGTQDKGAFRMDNGEPIDYVGRPAGIAKATDAYAIYIVGNSMEPRFDEGELVYISSRRPARIGDYVLIQTHDDKGDTLSYIKRLTGKTSTMLTVEQLNPLETQEFSLDCVVAIHRVLLPMDLYGA